MNKKEISEIRRRFNPDYENIGHIYGCYVNAAKEIVSYMDMSCALMDKSEREMYLKLMKKSLSGTLGRNLLNIEVSSEEEGHRMLQALRKTSLRDENVRNIFFDAVIEHLDMGDSSYVILLASDSYDVPFKGGDEEFLEDSSDEVFDYFVCAICPVKDAKAALSYQADEQSFRGGCLGHILAPPEAGFMFPAFDDRCANIHNLLYYSRNTASLQDTFIKELFNARKVPMSAGAQKNIFSAILSDALTDSCSIDVVASVHEQLREKIQIHKESKEPYAPEIYLDDMDEILKANGIPEEKINDFSQSIEKHFGDNPALNPENLIESRKYELTTPEVKIKVNPEVAGRITTRIIDGCSYILIPAGEGVEVNGIDITINKEI